MLLCIATVLGHHHSICVHGHLHVSCHVVSASQVSGYANWRAMT